jgi:hypothetical protein
LAKVILPREVRTEANENARENVVARYRFQISDAITSRPNPLSGPTDQ